ncbi:MAG: hypothetical protein H6618_00635 [Deltaproteobacteria bacterium]|nr:hypothetical protein [Deltaproteobacteria bacterium]
MPSFLKAENVFYYAESVSGHVFILRPWNFYWEKIHSKQNLPGDAIVQLTEGSTLLLNYYSDKRKYENRMNLFFRDANIFRLHSSVLKDIENKKYYFQSDFFSKNQDFSDLLMNMAERKIKDAWQNISALYYPEKESLSTESLKSYITAVTQFSSYTIDRKKTIHLVLPHKLGDYRSDTFPFPVWAYWQDERNILHHDKPQYLIYLWRPDKERGTYKYIAYDKNFFVPILKKGSWFIQIESTNGLYASEPVWFQVRTSDKRDDDDEHMSETSITLTQPPHQSTFFTKEKKYPVSFRWKTEKIYKNNPFLFIKKSDSTGPFQKIKPQYYDNAQIILTKGTWSWYISIPAAYENRQSVTTDLRSVTRHFTITSSGNTTELVRRSLESGVSGIYFLPGSSQ